MQVHMQGIQFILFLAITVSALFVHYRGKNGSADVMAAFHTQKRFGGVFITTLPFKNILWSNHISSTTLPYVIHVINNLQGAKPDSLIWEDYVLLCLCHCN